jgi:hypothetical protein
VERLLAEDKGKADAELARKLSDLELTERMSSAKLKLLEQIATGTKSRRALLALADASVFLSPPAADVLSEAAPVVNEQRRMLDLTVEYLVKTLRKLPDFYATRTIVRFEAMQSGRRTKAVSRNHSSWLQVGSSSVVVAYRDGKEVIDPREWGKHPHHAEGEGLITKGTFGPILSTVIVDAAHGQITWGYWERGSGGTLAVFRYRIPQAQSHYSVGFRDPFGGKPGSEPATGYHGELAIDPASGTVIRLTVQAEEPLNSPILQGDIMVEYGLVEIGGKIYTCPVRSVSIMVTRLMGPLGESAAPELTQLNDMAFDNYHQFRSESRILPGDIPATHN